MSINLANIPIINLTPTFSPEPNENNIYKSSITYFYLWYDLFLNSNENKIAKLYFTEDIITPHKIKKYAFSIVNFYKDNKIIISDETYVINDFNDIKVKIFNQNDYPIYIKNGTKIAYAYQIDEINKKLQVLDNHQNIIKTETTNKKNFFKFSNKLPQKTFLNKKRKEEKLANKNSLNFKNIKIKKSNNRTPKDFENLVEIPNYDLYSSKIISFESKNFANKLDSLIDDFNNLSKLYWDTTSKAIKKLQSLLLYIKKGKKGLIKKRLKTTIVVNYIEGCFLYLTSTLNYNRCNFKIYEKQLKIFQNLIHN